MLEWSNVTLSEKIDMGLIPDCVRIQIEELLAHNAELEDGRKRAFRRQEIADDQLYHAEGLIDEIEKMINGTNTLKQVRKQFAMAIENSFFER